MEPPKEGEEPATGLEEGEEGGETEQAEEEEEEEKEDPEMVEMMELLESAKEVLDQAAEDDIKSLVDKFNIKRPPLRVASKKEVMEVMVAEEEAAVTRTEKRKVEEEAVTTVSGAKKTKEVVVKEVSNKVEVKQKVVVEAVEAEGAESVVDNGQKRKLETEPPPDKEDKKKSPAVKKKKPKGPPKGGVSLFGGVDLFGGVKNPFKHRKKQEDSSESEQEVEEEAEKKRMPPPPAAATSALFTVQADAEERPVSFEESASQAHVIKAVTRTRAQAPKRRKPTKRKHLEGDQQQGKEKKRGRNSMWI